MNSSQEDLAARKSLLLARSALYRLTLARETVALRESLDWRRVGSAAAGSLPVRPLIVGALILVAGRKRIASLLRLATQAIMLVKVFRAVREMAARGKAP
jgi:hypothetical protein